MKRILIFIVLTIISYPSISLSSEIIFFNTEVLGQAADSQISTLEKSNDFNVDFIKPKIIQLDIENGRYSASSIYYDAGKIKFNELVKMIDKKYQKSNKKVFGDGTLVSWKITTGVGPKAPIKTGKG